MIDNGTKSPEEKPVVYIFHGDDQSAIQQHIEQIKSSLCDEGILETNLSLFDGRTASEEDIHAAAMAIPFLAPRRIIIITHLLDKLVSDNKATEDARKRFISMLDQLPNTTALVLVIHDNYLGRRGWASLKQDNWLMKWTAAAGPRAYYQICRLPRHDEMPAWIQKKAKEQDGQFSMQAAAALANLIGNDTLAAQQEIDKLLSYVDLKRQVEKDDVDRLCSGAQGNIFAMVDAIGKKDKRTALRQLHTLLEQEDAQGLFFMTVRQFRLLLQIRESMDDGGELKKGSDDFNTLPLSILEQLYKQAKNFSITQLEAIYHRLLEIDIAVKKSQLSPELALDLLISEIGK